jgi:hypothetical protein
MVSINGIEIGTGTGLPDMGREGAPRLVRENILPGVGKGKVAVARSIGSEDGIIELGCKVNRGTLADTTERIL